MRSPSTSERAWEEAAATSDMQPELRKQVV
jgi:hypothetical protein